MTYKVAYIIGSLSSNSINRKLVGAMIADAPSDLEFVEADFSKLPLYSPDYDADYPQIATDFKKILEDADAVLIGNPRVRPLDSRWSEECYRLVWSSVGIQPYRW